MSDVKIYFTDDRQGAAEAALKNTVSCSNKQIMIISSYREVNDKWRKVLSLFESAPTVAVVRGSSREKEKAIHSGAQILFVMPGGVEKTFKAVDNRPEILILDDLHELINLRKSVTRSILNAVEQTAYVVAISNRLNEEHIRYLPEELRLIGLGERAGMSTGGFYERYYFTDFIRKDNRIVRKYELKPGAVSAIKRQIGAMCIFQEDLYVADDMKADKPYGYVPLDYKEKSKHKYMEMLREEVNHHDSQGYYNDQYV